MSIYGEKISSFNEITSSEISSDDLIPIVDVSETDVTLLNKRATISEYIKYLKSTNMFPLTFTSDYINSRAFINGEFVDISPSIAGQTVNIANVEAFKFDEYGRIYDYTENTEQVSSDEIFTATGTAASWYKTAITDNFTTAQPATITGNNISQGAAIAGYFDANSYYYPKMGSYSAQVYQQVNYSDRQSNDYDWSYFFDKEYGRFSRTKIDMFLGPDQRSNNLFGVGKINIDINWNTGRVIATGILPAYNNFNVPFMMSDTISGGATIISGDVNTVGLLYVGQPKLLINYDDRKITGLPITSPLTPNTSSGIYQNIAVSLSIVVNNIV